MEHAIDTFHNLDNKPNNFLLIVLILSVSCSKKVDEKSVINEKNLNYNPKFSSASGQFSESTRNKQNNNFKDFNSNTSNSNSKQQTPKSEKARKARG